jgi:uncharacterized protein YkwD
MNRARAHYGLAPLTEDTRLDRTARAHTRWMLETGSFSHSNFAWRMHHSHSPAHLFGENLAWGTGWAGDADAIVDAWLQSPEHRANLLRPSFRHVGLGRIVGTIAGHSDAAVVTADFSSR